MIVDNRHGLWILMREIAVPLVILAIWDITVVVGYQIYHQEWMEQPTLPISLMGSALALFLTLRNNAAYSRWWEGRTLWGAIVNNTRSFARQAATLLRGRPDLAQAMAAYPYLLRTALSGIEQGPDAKRLLSPEMYEKVMSRTNKPNALLYEIGIETLRATQKLGLDGATQGFVDRILADLSNAQGGLERIRNTPLPVQYSALPLMVTHLFCIVLPLSTVQTLGWITPLGSSLVGFIFQALDKSGRDLQAPFRPGSHALPMLAMARTIEIDLLQPIGAQPEPPVIARNGVQP
ncbi:bestrophin family protein [Brytella acorum]|uniref:Bestrophin family ion channel n=1 Tax=Brytella acorum TaxID=2959299 RepID=A0AA35UGB4_9PROT|nr:bestrophin family ion channel [Brytella acorum]MDF3624210.1 bestrophin family ion channel [Brytella acorum]CAI9120716.1 bestrophin family ion channel [Brytella acorum]